MKRCTGCKMNKPLTSYQQRSGGLTRQCADCLAYARRYNERRRREAGVAPLPDPADRFLSSFDVQPNGCWVWTGMMAGADARYGRIEVDKQKIAAHRYSYALHNGDLPLGAYICHHCDNPPCVNPDHLYAGDAFTNAADMVRRGRTNGAAVSGERNKSARLTGATVKEMREKYERGSTQESLANEYGVSKSHAHRIVRRKLWRHVA